MTMARRMEIAEGELSKLREVADPPFVVLLPRLQSEQEWLADREDSLRNLAIGRFWHLTNAGRPIPELLQRAVDEVLVSAWNAG
jgi:hypothetical protein